MGDTMKGTQIEQDGDGRQQPALEEVKEWAAGLEAMHARIAARFMRAEPRRRALAYLKGLLGRVERKNGWQLAEYAGDSTPDGMQRLLASYQWDADQVRDDLRVYVLEHLSEPEAVLIVDETGFLKKGDKSVGVQRQYSGTAGRIENCQIGVFLTYASRQGSAFLDRELYLPQEWAGDRARRQEAGVPEEVVFQTKPQLAQRMLERAFAAGVRAAWVTADEVYGSDRPLREWLEGQRQAYVLAVRSREMVPIASRMGVWSVAVAEVAAGLAEAAWQPLSAGEGAKGLRWSEWAQVPLARQGHADWGYWLLLRRSLAEPGEVHYYLVAGPAETSLAAMVQVAGRRWAIEGGLEAAKGEVGLDQYEVRRWTGWYRHITLALLAHAYLVVLRAQAAKGGTETLSPAPQSRVL
jgi:SRSO17 transposase